MLINNSIENRRAVSINLPEHTYKLGKQKAADRPGYGDKYTQRHSRQQQIHPGFISAGAPDFREDVAEIPRDQKNGDRHIKEKIKRKKHRNEQHQPDDQKPAKCRSSRRKYVIGGFGNRENAAGQSAPFLRAVDENRPLFPFPECYAISVALFLFGNKRHFVHHYTIRQAAEVEEGFHIALYAAAINGMIVK